MKYINPFTQETEDTATHPIPMLFGLLQMINIRSGASQFFCHMNGGPEVISRLCNAIRARVFRERYPISGRFRAVLNTLDPPNCRCGKKGTRVIGGTTFCVACGPPTAAVAMRRQQQRRFDVKAEAYDAARKQEDQRTVKHAQLHETKKHHK